MSVHFDDAAIRAAADRLAQHTEPHRKQDDAQGANARLLAAVNETYALAFATELNRGTSPETLTKAVSTLTANMVMTCAHTLSGSDDARAVARTANVLLLYLAANIAHMLRAMASGDHSGIEGVRDTPGGHA